MVRNIQAAANHTVLLYFSFSLFCQYNLKYYYNNSRPYLEHGLHRKRRRRGNPTAFLLLVLLLFIAVPTALSAAVVVAAAVAVVAVEGGEHGPRLPLEVLDRDGRQGLFDLVGSERRQRRGAAVLLLPHLQTRVAWLKGCMLC